MNFVLDENLSPNWVALIRSLPELLNSGKHQIFHLTKDLGFGNTPDEEWMGKLDSSKRWVILTKDNAINKRVHERAAWKRHGFILFYFERRPWHKPHHEQSQMLFRIWPKLVERAETAHPGEGFKIPFQPNPKKFEKVI